MFGCHDLCELNEKPQETVSGGRCCSIVTLNTRKKNLHLELNYMDESKESRTPLYFKNIRENKIYEYLRKLFVRGSIMKINVSKPTCKKYDYVPAEKIVFKNFTCNKILLKNL